MQSLDIEEPKVTQPKTTEVMDAEDYFSPPKQRGKKQDHGTSVFFIRSILRN